MPTEDKKEAQETILRGHLIVNDSSMNSFISTDSHENPFQGDGALSKKADYIVRNSTISRTELKIADPDQEKEEAALVQEEAIRSESAPTAHAVAPGGDADIPDGAARPNDIKVKENGQVEEPLTPQSVEVEVAKSNATKPEAQEAEAVKLPKEKKCKCCVLQ